MQTPRIEYDEPNDVAYVSIAPESEEHRLPGSSRYQRVLDVPAGTIIFDFDEHDAIIGFETVGARALLGDAVAA